jgi:phenylacetic acid degradation operon negative regulatory protein
MRAAANVPAFLQARMSHGQISGTSLIFTLFCDAITQHGGEIWLGSLIVALGRLGLSGRLVRTAVFRLQQDGWLQSRKIGRRSYYRPTASGVSHYGRAARRIYATGKPPWDGAWTLAITAAVAEDRKELLRKSLYWQGFRLLSAGLYALPSGNRQSLDETLEEMNLRDSVLVLSARQDEPVTSGLLQQLVLQRWNLDSMGRLYRQFVQDYTRALDLLEKKALPDGQDCFLLRTLLIHEYRRILLRDAELPAAMLSADWPGFTAQQLVATMYRKLAAVSADWLCREMENTEGKLPPACAEFFARYAG